MEQFELKNKDIIDFYNESNLIFWTRKLNVTQQQLSEAILNTGSLHIADIKKYLYGSKTGFSFAEFLGKKKVKNSPIINS